MENVGGEEKGSAGGGLQVGTYGVISLYDAEGTFFTLVLGFSREKKHIHNPIHTMKIN